jgi:hypothetical protein
MKTYTQNEINDLASSALDIACAFIQEQMNINTGDIAGLYFSGNKQNFIETILQDYIRTEIQFKELSTD